MNIWCVHLHLHSTWTNPHTITQLWFANSVSSSITAYDWIGKMKAAAGEISNLFIPHFGGYPWPPLSLPWRPNLIQADQQAGIIRYVWSAFLFCFDYFYWSVSFWILQTIYLLAWLLLLRIEEAINLKFESINLHPSEHMCHICCIFRFTNII